MMIYEYQANSVRRERKSACYSSLWSVAVGMVLLLVPHQIWRRGEIYFPPTDGSISDEGQNKAIWITVIVVGVLVLAGKGIVFE